MTAQKRGGTETVPAFQTLSDAVAMPLPRTEAAITAFALKWHLPMGTVAQLVQVAAAEWHEQVLAVMGGKA